MLVRENVLGLRLEHGDESYRGFVILRIGQATGTLQNGLEIN